MAQKTSNGAGNVTDDPKQIRAEMAKTRATLGRELGALKGRVLGTPATKGANTITPTKQKPAHSDKKTSKAKKTGHSRSTKGKVKEVLTHMLAGAVVGAVKGAAEVIAPEKNGMEKQKKSKR